MPTTRISQPVRDVAATNLAKILNGVCSNNNPEAWNRLFLFDGRCLRAPPRGGIRCNLATFVQHSVNDETDAEASIQQQIKANIAKDPSKNLAARVVMKLEEGDFRGTIRINSSDESFAPINYPYTRVTQGEASTSHPNYQSAPEPVLNNSNSIEVSTSEVLAAIRSFPAGSAGSPNGLRPQHLKDLVTS